MQARKSMSRASRRRHRAFHGVFALLLRRWLLATRVARESGKQAFARAILAGQVPQSHVEANEISHSLLALAPRPLVHTRFQFGNYKLVDLVLLQGDIAPQVVELDRQNSSLNVERDGGYAGLRCL